MSKETSDFREKAAALLGRRAMSRWELVRKLREKGAPEEEAERAAAWMESIGALDDAAYAAALVRRCASREYGPARVRAELSKRGIPAELWEAAMAELPEEEELIRAFLERKRRGRTSDKDGTEDEAGEADEKETRRLTAALLRRGFSWGAVRSAMRHFS